MTTIMPAALRTEAPAANPRRDVRHDERRDGAEAAPFAATLAAQDRRPAGDSRSTVNSSGGRSRTDASARRNPDAGSAPGNGQTQVRDAKEGAAAPAGLADQLSSRPGAGSAAVRAAAGTEAALQGGAKAAPTGPPVPDAPGGDLTAVLDSTEASDAIETVTQVAASAPKPGAAAPLTESAQAQATASDPAPAAGGRQAEAAQADQAAVQAAPGGDAGAADGGAGGEGAGQGTGTTTGSQPAPGGAAGRIAGVAGDFTGLAFKMGSAAGGGLPAADGIEASVPASVRRQVVARLAGELQGLGGKGALRLQLTPPQLGRVEVSFERVGQELHLTFRVETAEAARALREGAHELTAALLDKQAGWDRVKVDVEREEPEEHDDGRDDHRGRDGRRDRDERDGEEGART